MHTIIRVTVLTIVLFFLFDLLKIDSNFSSVVRKSIIRPAIDVKSYKKWAKIDGTLFCKDFSDNGESIDQKLQKIIDSKIDIIYLTGVDVASCKRNIQEISSMFHKYGLSLAINIDSNPDIKAIKGDDFSGLNLDYYTSKLKDTSSITRFVSYLVFDDALSYFTYSERRQIQSHLRDIYTQSFIGFRFIKSVTPTPDNKNPNRNIDWNEFLPKDDDGDFVITSIPVSGFKRTIVFTEDIILQDSNGEVVNFHI